MDKKVLRKQVKQRILTIPSRKKESDAIIEHIRDLKEYRESRTILMFIPLSDEPDISPLLDDSRVLLPYIEDGALHFSSSRILHRADYGALEAEHTEAMYDSALMIVPLLGYSSSLGRLGRGGGYYDRYSTNYPVNMPLMRRLYRENKQMRRYDSPSVAFIDTGFSAPLDFYLPRKRSPPATFRRNRSTRGTDCSLPRSNRGDRRPNSERVQHPGSTSKNSPYIRRHSLSCSHHQHPQEENREFPPHDYDECPCRHDSTRHEADEECEV